MIRQARRGQYFCSSTTTAIAHYYDSVTRNTMPAPTALRHALPAPDSIQDGFESQDLDHNAHPSPDPPVQFDSAMEIQDGLESQDLHHDAHPSLDPPVQSDSAMEIDVEGRPIFAPAANVPQASRVETRKVPVPPHRLTPLKNNWSKIYQPLVNHLHLQGVSTHLPPSPIQFF